MTNVTATTMDNATQAQIAVCKSIVEKAVESRTSYDTVLGKLRGVRDYTLELKEKIYEAELDKHWTYDRTY